jgi:hypothetical protein
MDRRFVNADIGAPRVPGIPRPQQGPVTPAQVIEAAQSAHPQGDDRPSFEYSTYSYSFAPNLMKQVIPYDPNRKACFIYDEGANARFVLQEGPLNAEGLNQSLLIQSFPAGFGNLFYFYYAPINAITVLAAFGVAAKGIIVVGS